MHNKSIGFRAFALCLSLGCSIFLATTGWTTNTAIAETGQILTIFACDGRYIKRGAVSGAKVADGFYGSYVARQYRIDGCLISNILDEGKSGLFALLPQSLQENDNDARDFIVATLDVKTLKTLQSYPLPTKQANDPSLLYDSARQALLTFFDNGHSLQRLEIKANGVLMPLGPASTFELSFPASKKPYIDGQGNIVDGDRLLNEQGRLIRHISGDSLFDSVLQRNFSAHTLIRGSARHYDFATEIASAGNRIVFFVGGDAEDERVSAAGVMVYDLLQGHVVTTFLSTFPVLGPLYLDPTLHLTPDGKKIINEQYSWIPSDPSPVSKEELRLSPFRTGVIAIYDADTGLLTGKVSMKAAPLAQPWGRVVNFSSDNHFLYYLYDQHIYVIDLESARVVSELPLPDQFDPVAVVLAQ